MREGPFVKIFLGRRTSPLVSCSCLVHFLEAPHSSLETDVFIPLPTFCSLSDILHMGDSRWPPHRHGSVAVCQSSVAICDPWKLVFSVQLSWVYDISQPTPSETPRWQQQGHNSSLDNKHRSLHCKPGGGSCK